MKQVKVKNLKGNEIVALPIVTDSGTVLIHADVELKPELINRIIRLGIKSLFIKEYPEEVINRDDYRHLVIGSDDDILNSDVADTTYNKDDTDGYSEYSSYESNDGNGVINNKENARYDVGDVSYNKENAANRVNGITDNSEMHMNNGIYDSHNNKHNSSNDGHNYKRNSSNDNQNYSHSSNNDGDYHSDNGNISHNNDYDKNNNGNINHNNDYDKNNNENINHDSDHDKSNNNNLNHNNAHFNDNSHNNDHGYASNNKGYFDSDNRYAINEDDHSNLNSSYASNADSHYNHHIYKVEETASNSRKVMKDILEKHIYKHNNDLKVLGQEAEKIIESVIEEPEVITNITEMRNLSTDMYTHCINVCALSTIMALRLKMSERQVRNISIGAILHDIGLRYIKVPYMNTNETYMNTKDALEYKKHTIFGYSSLQDEEWIPDIAKEIILLHHERIDGKGYPFQHKGEKIKTEVKLVSLCDDFDSLISGVGSPKLKIYEAIEYIKANQGIKYDATITDKLLESVAVYPVGIRVITSEGESGIVIRQNHKFTDRPVIKMLKHADGSEYEEYTEKDLMKCLTLFIVDTE